MFRVVWGSMARCDAILPVAALDGAWTCLTSTTFQEAGLRIKGCMSSNDFGPDIFYEVFIKSTKTTSGNCSPASIYTSTFSPPHPFYYTSYQRTAKVTTFGIRLSNQAATSEVPSTATYPFTHTSTMCFFWFRECQSCYPRFPCKLFDERVAYHDR